MPEVTFEVAAGGAFSAVALLGELVGDCGSGGLCGGIDGVAALLEAEGVDQPVDGGERVAVTKAGDDGGLAIFGKFADWRPYAWVQLCCQRKG